MLTFEYAKDRFMLENGQLLIPFKSLKLTDDRIEQIFKNVVMKMNSKKPVRKLLTTYVDSAGITIPDALNILALKYTIYPNFDRISAPISRSYYFFDPATRVLTSLFGSRFTVTYLAEHEMGYFQQTEVPMNTVEGETYTEFYLGASFKDGTLTLSKRHLGTGVTTTSVVTNISDDGKTATLAGTLGSGTINLETRLVTLNLTDTNACAITATYYNKRIAIKDIDKSDLVFQLMFDIDMLKALGNLKYQATLEQSVNLPFSLQSDSLLDRARQLETELKEVLNSKSSWYNWGF